MTDRKRRSDDNAPHSNGVDGEQRPAKLPKTTDGKEGGDGGNRSLNPNDNQTPQPDWKICPGLSEEDYQLLKEFELITIHRYNGYIVPNLVYQDLKLDPFRSMSIRSNDVFIATYPKSGTTWVQEIITRLNRSDLSRDEFVPWLERMPGMQPDLYNKLVNESQNYQQHQHQQRQHNGSYANGFHTGGGGGGPPPPRRYWKTHMAVQTVPTNARYIYVARNGKDVVTSFFPHICRKAGGVEGRSFPLFFELYRRGLVPYGKWFDHVSDWWKASRGRLGGEHKIDPSNILFLFYEDMRADPLSAVVAIGRFIGIADSELRDERFLASVLQATSLETMKAGYRSGPLFGEGRVGGWKRQLKVGQSEEVDAEWGQRAREEGTAELMATFTWARE